MANSETSHRCNESIRRPWQRPPTRDVAAYKNNRRADVTARVIIAIKITLQKEVAPIRHFAERPIARLLHRGTFVKPDRLHAAVAGLVLQNLSRRTPGDVHRILTHPALNLTFVHQFL